MGQEVDSRAVERALQRLQRYERESRFLVKRSEDYQVLEEVFDRPTLLTLHGLLQGGVFDYLNGVVRSGKEARIYWGVKEPSTHYAVKIYLVVAAEFRRRLPYILGDPRFQHIKKESRRLVELWARKEFRNLQTAWEAKIPVPEPVEVRHNVLVMQFIGEDGVPAPLLAESGVGRSEYLTLVRLVTRLYQEAQLVHADLSEYNVFRHQRKLVLFDFGSAVHIAHPMARQFLARDLSNTNRFFSKRGVQVTREDKLLRRVIGE
jgi:RIO kinase 1